MNPALIAQVAGYLIQYGPGAVQVVTSIVEGYKKISANGTKVPTDAELKALVDRIQAQHDSLPPPE